MSRSRRSAGLLVVAAWSACAVVAPRAEAVPAKASVVGGTPIAIESAPWQVYLQIGTEAACGGSVLDPARILTAAHCVVPAGSTQARPASAFRVLAGYTDVRAAPPPGSQNVGVASVRVHPYYEEAPKADDVAVLTLATPLDLASPRIEAIALASVGGAPAPGAAVSFTGYGAQVEGQPANGPLHGATLTAVSDAQCRPNIAPDASASVQCVAPGAQSACFGDSGGPLTAGGVQVGIASYTALTGCGSAPYGFADVTVPEVRAFIDGAPVPPAPRQSAPPGIHSVNPPVVGSPMTCAPGTWLNAPAFGYTFQDEAGGVALQSGGSATFVPTAAHVGARITCLVQAANAGGTALGWSGTALALQHDAIAPNAALYGARCRKRRCTVRLGAADPNSQGAMKIRATAERRVRVRGRRKTRRVIRTLAVKHVEGTLYRARSKRLKRGRTTLRVRVTDAAGNRRRPDLTRKVRIR